MTRDTERTTDGASTLEPVTRRTVLRSTAAGVAGIGGAAAGGATVTAQDDDELNAVAFDLSNVPDLGEDAVYEGWAMFGEEKVSTGTFSRGDEYVFEVDRDLADADEIAITIEPADDTGGEPSGVVALGGELSGESADLSFPLSFEDASGTALLNTPTAPDVAGESGLWFLEVTEDGEHVASLDVPDLSDVPGWTYEGWAVIDGQPVTTGRFDDPTSADDAAPYSGEGDGPGFPGEDFVTDAPEGLEFPTDLADGASMAVLSVEPDLDGEDPTGPGPFQVKPLAGELPADADVGTSYDLPRNEGTLPEGSATLHADARAARRPADEQNAVAFDLSNLPALGDDAVYEGWAIFGEEKVSTGTFSRGQEYVFGVDRDLTEADELVVTIEPAEDDDPAPSGVVLLQGAVEDGEAELSFPVDFAGIEASFLLNTPTAPDAAGESGIWFLEVQDGEHVASLDVPDLSDVPGWTYEGWVVHEGTPVTTGRFDDPTSADDAAPYSGDGEGPDFPGEDLVTDAPDGLEFPTDLGDGESMAVISVEPDLDGEDPTGPGPFQIKPLAGAIPENDEVGTSYTLPRNHGTLPEGSATLHDDVEAAERALQHNAVAFEFDGLPALGDGAVYEGWAIYGDEKVSTGTFAPGQEHVFGVDRDLAEADELVVTIEPAEDDELVVTIEPAEDDDPAPSGIVVLQGELEDGEATLSFPVDLSDAGGSYLLNTPTAPDVGGESGLWFLEVDDGEHVASLDVPDLTDVTGWTYEGWAVIDGTPVTTGRFDDPASADDAAPYSGEGDGPGFPGEDFVTDAPDDLAFPTDLADGESTAVVTVEPDLDGEDPTGPGPYDVKPLVGEIPADAGVGESHDLEHRAGAAPSAEATLYPDVEAAHEASAEDMVLELDVEHLPDLGEDAVYEGWAIFGEEKVSTGTFAADDDLAFAVDRDLTAADEIVVTIEPAEDDDPAPSGVVILRGELSGAVADLSCPLDLADASGSYLLNTPTAPTVTAESGVWFLEVEDGEHVAALDVPDLSDVPGWTYEGWVVHEGTPITTGRFDDPTSADEFDGYSGRMDGPEFPGEDLVTNEPTDDLVFPTDLTDGETKVVVSVEPDVDGEDPTGPEPFAFKPLAGDVPADAEGATSYPLEHTGLQLPAGTAVVGEEPAAIEVGDYVPRDLDGDGLHRDVNGDGAVGPRDVGTFFQNFHLDAWDREEFDFSGNGRISHGDVVTLFENVMT